MALALLPLALAACFSSEPAPTGPPDDGPIVATVELTDALAFDPGTVTVRVGDTVEWTNVSGFVHTVTADPALAADPAHVVLPEGAEPFDSGILTSGEQFTHTFTIAGEYQYVCLPHESLGMRGTVVVTP